VLATERIVGVCHVLRYAPYYVQLRHTIASGLIGDVVSVQHLEPIGDVHMSHSYVRGPWRRKDESTPMILSSPVTTSTCSAGGSAGPAPG
jgi:predicted dehydrogenase